MSLYMLAADSDVHEVIRWYEWVAGAIGLVILLVVLIELILMIPDMIRTIKIHMM